MLLSPKGPQRTENLKSGENVRYTQTAFLLLRVTTQLTRVVWNPHTHYELPKKFSRHQGVDFIVRN